MANVTEVQIACTTEGLESLVSSIINGTALNISAFRVCDLGNTTWFNNMKSFTGLDPDSYYFPYTATLFDSDKGSNIINLNTYGIGDANGFIDINSILAADSITIEFDCYIPPTALYGFGCNEIMLYTLDSSTGIYKSFIYGIFPEITKLAQYGINFRVLLKF